MHPYIKIFNRIISSYGLMAFVGCILAILLILWRSRKDYEKQQNVLYIFGLAGVCTLIGAKLVYILTVLPYFMKDIKCLFQYPAAFINKYICGGMVFYGGLFGAVISFYISAKAFKLDICDYYDLLVPSISLFAGFGRIGCFLAGCCYGRPTDSWIGVRFPADALEAPAGVPLIPTQLIEACFDFILVVFFLGFIHPRKQLHCMELSIYVILYAVFRFIIELFRGDSIRGRIGIFSTSQVISVFAVIIGIYFLLCKYKVVHKENNT